MACIIDLNQDLKKKIPYLCFVIAVLYTGTFFSQNQKGFVVPKDIFGNRVFIENKCRFVDATDRAAELFFQLQMQNTVARNGVLLYLAIEDRQLAIWGDQGIHDKLGTTYWAQQVSSICSAFNKNNYTIGLCQCINEIGKALQSHFPYQGDADKNELANEVVFG